MAFINCLSHAGDKFREITGETRPRPSTGMYPGEYWNNADYTSTSIVCPSVALWIDNENTNAGHALCVGSYNSSTKKYRCYEANWDGKGKTRVIDKSESELESMYPSKIFLGYVY